MENIFRKKESLHELKHFQKKGDLSLSSLSISEIIDSKRVGYLSARIALL